MGKFTEDVNENRPRLDDLGREVLDNSPVAIPLRFRRQENLASEVQRLVQHYISTAAEAQGHETFEEADDFDVGDDYDPHSPYELDEDQIYYDHRDQRLPDQPPAGTNPTNNAIPERVQPDGQTPTAGGSGATNGNQPTT